MAFADYDFSTATAICNDNQANTWEVRAQRKSTRSWWTVSDSSRMSEDEAEAMANQMRHDAEQFSECEE